MVFSSEYYDYCSELGLMPTEEGYKIWLKNKIVSQSPSS